MQNFLEWLVPSIEPDDGLPPRRWRRKAEQGYLDILAGKEPRRTHAAYAILALLDGQEAGNWRLFRGWADPDDGRLWDAGFRDRLPFETRPDHSLISTAVVIRHPKTGEKITLAECFLMLYETIRMDGGDTRPLWRRNGSEWPVVEVGAPVRVTAVAARRM